MLEITKQDVEKCGGFLGALSEISSLYIRGLIKQEYINRMNKEPKVGALTRFIVHKDPHLDEYMAELLFRSILPEERRQLHYMEESLYHENDDKTAQILWPHAAVFGIGRAATGGARTLNIFDEHSLDSSSREIEPSCADIIREQFIPSLPGSIQCILDEVNIIDQSGLAHDIHLNNMLKTMHQVQYQLSKGRKRNENISDRLSDHWKRALVDASIAAVVYCLEEGVNLDDTASVKERSMQSIDKYAYLSLHKDEINFQRTLNYYKSNIGGIKKLLHQDAVLKRRDSRGKPVAILDDNGDPVPQLLILPRICYACECCWGPEITWIIMSHFWESEFQKQLHFYNLLDASEEVSKDRRKKRTDVGRIYFRILNEIKVHVWHKDRNTGRGYRSERPLWLIEVTPRPKVVQPHKGIMNYVNNNNESVGLVIINNVSMPSKALFKGENVPRVFWENIVELILKAEHGCWHVTKNPSGIAPFLINRNPAHQYPIRSKIDAQMLTEICFEAWRDFLNEMRK